MLQNRGFDRRNCCRQCQRDWAVRMNVSGRDMVERQREKTSVWPDAFCLDRHISFIFNLI
ncbi:hypothetical protein HanIR_Chr16g0790311 [Helianthus annuus]|nr:hypothetical protein HanIR_Chr16g0790311 [Helianthus annuus]